MHTFVTSSGRRIHHNSDFSGPVVIQAAPGEVEANDLDAGAEPGFAVTVPLADLLELLVELLDEYLRARAEEIENAEAFGWELGAGYLAMPRSEAARVARTQTTW